MSGELPFVSVIVPVYDDADGLQRLLRTLAAQDYPATRFECVVVDNGSAVPIEIREQFAFELRLFRQDTGGGFTARNRGIGEARGSILAFTDADCMPDPSWLSKVVPYLRDADKPSLVGGKILLVTGTPLPTTSEWHSIVHDLDQARYIRDWHFAATANLIVRRDVFDSVGLFEDTLLSGGDWEWGRRAWSRGVAQIYADDVVVRHPTRTNWKQLLTRHRRMIGGQYMMRQRAGQSRLTIVTLLARVAWEAANRSMRDPRMTLPERLKVTALDGAIRCAQLVECARLALGGEAVRR